MPISKSIDLSRLIRCPRKNATRPSNKRPQCQTPGCNSPAPFSSDVCLMCQPKYSEPTLNCVGVSGSKFPMPGNEWEEKGNYIIFKHRYENGKMNRKTTSLYKDIIASIDGVTIK